MFEVDHVLSCILIYMISYIEELITGGNGKCILITPRGFNECLTKMKLTLTISKQMKSINCVIVFIAHSNARYHHVL